jgi:hypothetical protein
MIACETLPLFSDEPKPEVLSFECEAATWETLYSEKREPLQKRVVEAEKHFAAVPGRLRPMFERLVMLAKQETWPHYDSVHFSDEDDRDFSAALFALQALPGVEMKERCIPHYQRRKGIFVEGVGSLIASCHAWDFPVSCSFFPAVRSPFFLPSFWDKVSIHPLLEDVWYRTYAAQKISESPDKPASVSTFSFNGRQYVNISCQSYAGRSHGKAWRLRRIEDWPGKTYTYSEKVKAWDEGRLERGDDRGFVVKAQGCLCVFDEAAIFFDDEGSNKNGLAI